ncbi:MAG: hypothetical protein GY771_09255 [bacterium]|nr:hypothetical protein [bacterium]
MRFTLIVALLATAVPASAITYTYTADVTKTVDDSTAIKAKAFGIPFVQSIVTEVVFELGFPEESPGMYDVIITSFKQTTFGADRDKGGYRDEEKLEAVWPGKTFTLDVFALNDDGFIRDPMMTTDSEYFDYNLLAFLLVQPFSISTGDFSMNGSISRSCIRSTTIEEKATLDGEGNVSAALALTQDDKTVKMTGSAAYEGTLTMTMGERDLPETAEITLKGVQKRLITIFGSDNELVDNIDMKLSLVREGSGDPPE